MKTATAQALGPLVKTNKYYQPFLLYLEERQMYLYEQLELAEPDRVQKIQGQLVEIRKLKSLKEAAEGAITNA
jgi:hypothetical protein